MTFKICITAILATVSVIACQPSPPLTSTSLYATLATVAAPQASCASGDACAGIPADGATPSGTAAGQNNVDGTPLQLCSLSPVTGWQRDGYCRLDDDDAGVHTVCAAVTDEFLAYSKSRGNDLVSPRGSFPGLKAGDRWCLCADRYAEAVVANVAPPLVRGASHASAASVVRP